MSKTKIWAHRGASSYAPDNTMPAFELAVKMRADGIEIDTHLTRDGIPVVCHDEHLENLSDGSGRVCDFTLAELRRLNFNRRFPQLGRTAIVTLEECYAFAKHTGLFVNTEIKYYEDTRWEELNEKALATARSTAMEDSVLYSSFDHERLCVLKKKEPSVRIGLLYDRPIEAPWLLAKQLSAAALHPSYPLLLEPELSARCRSEGILLHPWTIDAREQVETALSLGVDAVISNRPDFARKIRGGIERARGHKQVGTNRW